MRPCQAVDQDGVAVVNVPLDVLQHGEDKVHQAVLPVPGQPLPPGDVETVQAKRLSVYR